MELLTTPPAFFLDEPTSGLDAATAGSLMATLRRLAGHGATIVLTTHNTDDLRSCDRIIVVARGQVAFAGSPEQARRHFDVDHLADIYARAAAEPPAAPERSASSSAREPRPARPAAAARPPRSPAERV